MSYRVQLIPQPIIIDANGRSVPNSHVVEITFPGDAIETIVGRVNTIIGPGLAKVIVGDATIRGIPLC